MGEACSAVSILISSGEWRAESQLTTLHSSLFTLHSLGRRRRRVGGGEGGLGDAGQEAGAGLLLDDGGVPLRRPERPQPFHQQAHLVVALDVERGRLPLPLLRVVL